MSSPEASARALLLDMQSRLAVGPHLALGVPTHATAADIRSAFLQLTKTFHPARFGRMTTEIQRLSNEVFLSLRAAHDQISKPVTQVKRGGSTTGIPLTKPVSTPVMPTPVPTRPVPPIGPRPNSASGKVPPPPDRSPDPGTQPPQRSTFVAAKPGSTPPTTAPTTAPLRPTPVPPPSGTRPPAAQARPSQPGGTIRFPIVAKQNPAPVPASSARPAASSSAGVALDPELALILQLMGMGQWDAAQAAIDALATNSPQNKRYAALACYSRGRRAQLEGNVRIAQIELNDALKLDPDLDVAKSAFAELYARRK